MNVFECLGFGTNVKVIEKLKRISYRFSRKFHFLHKERGYRDLGYILCMDLLHSLVDSCTPELVTLYLYQNYGQISSKTFFLHSIATICKVRFYLEKDIFNDDLKLYF